MCVCVYLSVCSTHQNLFFKNAILKIVMSYYRETESVLVKTELKYLI